MTKARREGCRVFDSAFMYFDSTKYNQMQHFWHFAHVAKRILEGVAPATPRKVTAPDKPVRRAHGRPGG